MKKIAFIGAYDKTDLILSVARVLEQAEKKVLVVDNTIEQKCKYVVPVINPTVSYITEFDGIDVAVGFNSITQIRQYLGLENDEEFEYDIMIIDTDNYEGMEQFNLQSSEKLYYVTSFDIYSLKKGIQIIKQVDVPLHMTRIFYSKEMLKEEEEYFDYLALGVKVIWNEEKIYFLLENGDQSAIIENQRLEKIKFRNLSNEYKENIAFLVNDIDNEIGEKKIRNMIKNL